MTSIEATAAALVAGVDPVALATTVAEFPKAEDITLRTNWQEIDPHLGERVPANGLARRVYLEQRLASVEKALASGIARYNALREFGPGLLSAYDVCIAGSGDALGALKTALCLKVAHISFDQTIAVLLARELDGHPVGRSADESPQLGLF